MTGKSELGLTYATSRGRFLNGDGIFWSVAGDTIFLHNDPGLNG